MDTHNICLFKEIDKQYTGCNLKITELLVCALIWLCAVIRLSAVIRLNTVSTSLSAPVVVSADHSMAVLSLYAGCCTCPFISSYYLFLIEPYVLVPRKAVLRDRSLLFIFYLH